MCVCVCVIEILILMIYSFEEVINATYSQLIAENYTPLTYLHIAPVFLYRNYKVFFLVI